MVRPSGQGFGGGPEDTRNMVIFVVIAMIIFGAYEFFVGAPMRARQAAEHRIEQSAVARQDASGVPQQPIERSTAIAATSRVPIDNPAVDGTINLLGARFDDLSLKRYRQTVKQSSGEVTLLNPQDAKGAYDSYLGWEDPNSGTDLVGARSQWTAAEGAKLTPSTPVTLTFTGADGLKFTRTISLDDDYLFTITDSVENLGTAPRSVRPFSVVRRRDKPADFIPNQIVHQGMSGVLGAESLFEDITYQAAEKHAKAKKSGKKQMESTLFEAEGPGGWLGISDHYWLAALIPAQTETIRATFDATPHDSYTDFRAQYTGAARAVAPGQKVEYTQHLFAGAKRVALLKDYQTRLGVPKLIWAVDWGFLWFMTQPFFSLLEFLVKWVGNFGLAILLTTVVVKAALFPLVNQSYSAMSKMRKIQPKMKEIQDRFAADKQRQQQEMMKLYQQEKVNPAAGCLPILLQIPIFYSLYKVLTVTIEMRHAPFFGWIQDLSARDPTTVFNLFGLLPFDPTHWPVIGTFLWIGAWPLMYGVTMWCVQALSPPPPDPTQKVVFQILPVLFTFMFASFAAGLVIYWTWSNTLTIIQQYIVMRRNGVDTELDKLIAKRFGKKAEGAA